MALRYKTDNLAVLGQIIGVVHADSSHYMIKYKLQWLFFIWIDIFIRYIQVIYKV